MTPEHLAHLRAPGRPSVHPDGGWAAVAISRPDLDADAYRSQVWRIPTDGGSPVRLTAGTSDSQPVISPDGRWLAFLRAGVDSPPQLAVLDLAGGEARVLTNHRLGVGSRPVWSPDSARIAYTARVPEPGRFGTKDGVGPGAEPPRHITTYTYRMDNVGFTIGRPAHVFVLEVPAAATPTDGAATDVVPARLTDGDLSHGQPEWTPEGDAVLTIRSRDDALRGDLLRVAVPTALPERETDDAAADDAAPKPTPKVGEDPARDGLPAVSEPQVVDAPGAVGAVAFGERDELWLLVQDLGEDELDFVGRNAALWRGRLTGDALTELRRLSDPATDDLEGGTGPGAFQVVDDRVLLTRVHRGDTELVLVEAPDDDDTLWQVRTLLGGASVVGADAIDAPPGEPLRVVTVAATPDSPGDVFVVTDEAGAVAPATTDAAHVRRLTDLAEPLREAAPVRPSVEITGSAPDGYPVHGWLTLPDPAVHGEGPYPVLLNIHGGPYAQYTPSFFDETQVYAAAGYAVVYGNPRGSAGYGEDHGRSIKGRFGTLDADDVLALLDTALATHPELDGARVGVLGGSYGGYMTAWLTTQTDRFVAAIVERGFLDPVSFTGSSDIGWFFGGQYVGEDPDGVAAQSPMAHLDNVTTPTLVIHSEHDWRCPVEQGQRWYVGLRKRGVPAELLLFPGAGHELSRSGRPKHRQVRFEHILAWWEKHLPVAR